MTGGICGRGCRVRSGFFRADGDGWCGLQEFSVEDPERGAVAAGEVQFRSPDGVKRNPGEAFALWRYFPGFRLRLHPGYLLPE